MDDSPNGQSSESKTREEDFWSISPERDFTQSSRLESDDGDEVVPFKNSSADESVSSSPSPMAQSLRATRQAFGSFEGKFDEGEEVVEHIEDYIPQQRSSSKRIKKTKKSSKKRSSQMMEGANSKDHLINSQCTSKKSKKKAKRKKKRAVPKPPSELPQHPIETSPSENKIKNKSGHELSAIKMKNLKREFESVDESNDRENFGFDANRGQDSRKIVKSSISSTNLRSPLKPISSTVTLPSDFVKCLVTREKGGLFKQTTYYMHLQNEHDRPIQMVLAAVKNKKGKTPNYHIFDMTSGEESSFTKRSSNYIGKLSAFSFSFLLSHIL